MTYLVSQLWLYLLCAGLLGLLLGWVIWGWMSRRHLADARADHERQQLSLKRGFETEKATLEEDVTAAFHARDEAVKVKASLLGELEGERKVATEAKAQIGRLTQAELAARGEFDRNLASMQERLELERGTAEEAKKAVDAIRTDMRQELHQKQQALAEVESSRETLRAELDNQKAAVEADLRRERQELAKANGAIDDVRAEMTRQLQARQATVNGAETAASAARRDAENARSELARLTEETANVHDAALKAMEQSLNEERRAKSALQSELQQDRRELSEAKDNIESIRAEMAQKLQSRQAALVAAESGAKLQAEASRIEMTRLRARLDQQGTGNAKAASPKFTTDAPRPASLFDQRPDLVDDLKEVKGIGPVMEGILSENGCYHFKQLANFTKRDIEWVSAALGSFPDRIERDDWVMQAQALYAKKYGQRHDVGAVIRSLDTTS